MNTNTICFAFTFPALNLEAQFALMLAMDPAQHTHIQSRKLRMISPLRPCGSEGLSKRHVDAPNTNHAVLPIQRWVSIPCVQFPLPAPSISPDTKRFESFRRNEKAVLKALMQSTEVKSASAIPLLLVKFCAYQNKACLPKHAVCILAFV